ncbi:MAG: hypothetical protein IT497_08090 [Ottowia sp.]|nr:hypothetical protein [Ottowia sp.]
MIKDSREPQKPMYIQSCLAIYDLHGFWKKPKEAYNSYFYEKKLTNGLNIKIRADGYYVFDFHDSSIGGRVQYKQSSYGKIFAILNERVEVIHAFLACLRGVAQKSYGQQHPCGMTFMD